MSFFAPKLGTKIFLEITEKATFLEFYYVLAPVLVGESDPTWFRGVFASISSRVKNRFCTELFTNLHQAETYRTEIMYHLLTRSTVVNSSLGWCSDYIWVPRLLESARNGYGAKFGCKKRHCKKRTHYICLFLHLIELCRQICQESAEKKFTSNRK